MRHPIWCLVALTLCAACGPAAAPPPTATDTGATPLATPAPVAADPPTSLPTAPSATSMIWHGLRMRYDPQQYQFAELAPPDSLMRAAASLTQIVNPCPPQGADCSPSYVYLRLYSRGGLDLWEWLAQQRPAIWSNFVEAQVAGQPAATLIGDGITSGIYTAYAVPVGPDIAIVNGVPLDDFIAALELDHPPAPGLAPGQIAATAPDQEWELWADQSGGARVEERPRLYGGSLVSIVELAARAVRVRTPEGVAGWIRAAPADALIQPAAPARFARLSRAQVVHANAIPLRAEPRSAAPTVGVPLEPGQAVTVVGMRGDWLYVQPDGAQIGWARWRYDRARYIDSAAP